jgi:hypothetical protein
VVSMAEEEWDGTVPGHRDGVEVVGVAAAWTRRRQRRRGKFWQPDNIQVKILRLGWLGVL